MLINFGNEKTSLILEEKQGAIYIKELSFLGKPYASAPAGMQHSCVFLLGGSYRGKVYNRYNFGGEKLAFVKAEETQDDEKKTLTVEEQNEKITVKTIYTLYHNTAVLQCKKAVTNRTDKEIRLENVSPLTIKNVMTETATAELNEKEDATSCIQSLKTKKKKFPVLWKVHNTWCSEYAFERVDLEQEGLRCSYQRKRYGKIAVHSNGTQTTSRYLPLGVFEQEGYGYLAFELAPVGSWSYEIDASVENELFLCVTGKTLTENGWHKTLASGETHESEEVRIVGAEDLDVVAGELTTLRRNVKRKTHLQPHKDVIYNVFMHNVWPSPSEEQDAQFIPMVKEFDADYYVVDAGWFDTGLTTATGIWDECKERYPSGFVKTAERARKAGMKFGLWVELQSIGVACPNPNILPEHCYFHIDGVRTIYNGRYQLNYALQEVRDYANGIMEKLVKRYNPDYIKIDYNQTQYGTDCNRGSLTEGLARHIEGYLKWFKEIQDKYPNIMFESCASGGMQMDANFAALTTVCSVSDQENYDNYPSLLANMPFAVLPEQAGVWNIAVDSRAAEITDEMVIMNSVNSFYGVMHLCSRLDKLTDVQKTLVKDGIAYYRQLSKIKDKAYPIFPKGFTSVDDEIVYTGLTYGGKLYMSVYNLSEEDKEITVDLNKYNVKTATLVYPQRAQNEYGMQNGKLSCKLKAMTARSFEIE